MSGGISQMKDIGELLDVVSSVLPQSSGAATLDGASVDRLAHGNALSCVLHQAVGAISGAPTTASVQTKLQDSADNSTFADYQIGGTTQETAAATAQNGDQSVNIDLNGARRYIRAVTVIAFTGGTSPAALVAADLVLGGESELPAV